MFLFKRIDAGDGFSIVEPPAGLVSGINNRLSLYSDESGKMSLNTWAAIFVLACLHDENNVPVVVSLAKNLPQNTIVEEGETKPISNLNRETLRGVYCNMDAEEFKLLIEEFIFVISKSRLEELYNIVEESCFITKKTTDALKND